MKRRRRRILVAEDSPTQAERIRFVLEGEGYEVRLARDGREGMAAVSAEAPDLIVSDVVMPEMDGFAFCQAVKSSKATRRTPFVLLTSQQTPMDILHGLERGADNFIPKPFEDRYLLERIERIFENLERRQKGDLEMEVSVRVGGREIVVNADKQQMIELLFSTSEDLSQSNQRLEEARLALEDQARMLERTVAERTQDLVEAEARYRSLVEHIPGVVYLSAHDVVGRILYVSPQIEGLLGFSPEELLADPGLLASRVHPDDREAVLAGGRRLRETGQPFYAEFRVRARDGREIWFSDSAHLVGGERMVQGFLLDVTERKQVEHQLRQSQKIDAIGQLAGGVAHDFNNLVAIIIGNADLLAKNLEAQHAGLRRVDEIRKAADRAAALTRQLLAFSRKQVLQPKVLDLNAVVTDFETMLRRLIPENIQIVTALQQSLGRVKADPGQIEQVIVNLAVNARDAMPGGGRLILETADVDFDDSYLRTHPGALPGRQVMLAVSDTGHGMDRQTQSRIFEPFFTTKEHGKGTGLGLSTVYGIVKQSGGYIMVYSEPGKGTAFKVYLPRVEEDVERPGRAVPAATPRRAGSEAVLLAEDEGALRTMIREILEDGGYAVLEAATPEEALTIANAHKGPIPLLLTDVVMPHMSGRELARQLAALRPGLKILYMSGYTDEGVLHNGVLGPDAEFVQKPFTADILLRKIHAVLGPGPA